MLTLGGVVGGVGAWCTRVEFLPRGRAAVERGLWEVVGNIGDNIGDGVDFARNTAVVGDVEARLVVLGDVDHLVVEDERDHRREGVLDDDGAPSPGRVAVGARATTVAIL